MDRRAMELRVKLSEAKLRANVTANSLIISINYYNNN